MDESSLTKLQNKIDYAFSDRKLLETALTHSSYANENKARGIISNERLEFLGDSILGMTVAIFLYNTMPNMTEGKMTKLRADLVCEKSLVQLAVKLKLGECLMLGKGEEKNGGRTRPSILADAVEALLASIYLDGGFSETERFVMKFLAPRLKMLRKGGADYKSALQEYIQELTDQSPSYHTVEESGPDHMKLFTVEVRMDGATIGVGTGGTKKGAEQMSAQAALEAREQWIGRYKTNE